MKFYYLIIGIGFQFFFIGSAFTHAQEVPSDAVEIIVDGKRYESIRAYRRDQIKDILTNALAAENLHMFTEKELCEMIKEVRSQQTADSSSTEPAKPAKVQYNTQQQDQMDIDGNTLDLSSSQLQDMLDGYFREHVEADPAPLNPDKVKSSTIELKAESEPVSSD